MTFSKICIIRHSSPITFYEGIFTIIRNIKLTNTALSLEQNDYLWEMSLIKLLLNET